MSDAQPERPKSFLELLAELKDDKGRPVVKSVTLRLPPKPKDGKP